MIVPGEEDLLELVEEERMEQAKVESHLIIIVNFLNRILEDSTGHTRNTEIVFSFRKPFLISRKPPSINTVNR